MIASVSGRIAAVGPETAVIEIGSSGGIGFSLHCVPATLAGMRVGEQARLATSLVVREDSLTLYGFDDDIQRQLFELLQTASGVGPRLALAALAVHSPTELSRAIRQADIASLTAVPGIGKKGAQRLILELSEKMTALALANSDTLEASLDESPIIEASEPLWRQQVREGLVALGWSAKVAEDATEQVSHEWLSADGDASETPVPDVAVLLKEAISILGRTR